MKLKQLPSKNFVSLSLCWYMHSDKMRRPLIWVGTQEDKSILILSLVCLHKALGVPFDYLSTPARYHIVSGRIAQYQDRVHRKYHVSVFGAPIGLT